MPTSNNLPLFNAVNNPQDTSRPLLVRTTINLQTILIKAIIRTSILNKGFEMHTTLNFAIDYRLLIVRVLSVDSAFSKIVRV